MAKLPNDCQARQYSDQMICHTCGLVWDMNDPEPPDCRRSKSVSFKKAKLLSSFDQEQAKPPKGVPSILPVDVADQMVKAYTANFGGTIGMQAAYRVFLDSVEL